MLDSSQPWLLGKYQAIAFREPSRGWLSQRVLAAPSHFIEELKAHDLVPRRLSPRDSVLFDAAATMISLTPSLETVACELVKHVHLLRADPGYDVSHSQPKWKSRIFVSVPERDDDIGALRLSESVIHEAMHLNLTLFERQQPVVSAPGGSMSSPWRNDLRPYAGVFHGFYVFACLNAYFEKLATVPGLRSRHYVQSRINEITSQLLSIDYDTLRHALTAVGKALVKAYAKQSRGRA